MTPPTPPGHACANLANEVLRSSAGVGVGTGSGPTPTSTPAPEASRKARHKGGRRRLVGGLDRVLPDHRSSLGMALRREYNELLASLGITAADTLLLREASRVAFLRTRAIESARLWGEISETRRTGRGRRPSPRALERAARRAALDDGSAVQALERLERLTAGRKAPTIADLVRERDT